MSVLQMIGQSTGGRVNYKISGELQLQMLDVLAEQPPGSPWRALYERMVDRCVQFAAAGAFGEESELAAVYRDRGLAYYLGDYRQGRVDGNLFLVFWLGNLVGTRDQDGRFFKEKLDELPPDLVEEVRRRNAGYSFGWRAGCWGRGSGAFAVDWIAANPLIHHAYEDRDLLVEPAVFLVDPGVALHELPPDLLVGRRQRSQNLNDAGEGLVVLLVVLGHGLAVLVHGLSEGSDDFS